MEDEAMMKICKIILDVFSSANQETTNFSHILSKYSTPKKRKSVRKNQKRICIEVPSISPLQDFEFCYKKFFEMIAPVSKKPAHEIFFPNHVRLLTRAFTIASRTCIESALNNLNGEKNQDLIIILKLISESRKKIEIKKLFQNFDSQMDGQEKESRFNAQISSLVHIGFIKQSKNIKTIEKQEND